MPPFVIIRTNDRKDLKRFQVGQLRSQGGYYEIVSQAMTGTDAVKHLDFLIREYTARRAREQVIVPSQKQLPPPIPTVNFVQSIAEFWKNLR